MTFLSLFICIVLLVLLITWAKVNPFLAFIVVGILAAFLLQIPLDRVMLAVNKGIGDTLGSLVIVIVLGAMLGRLVADSGAAQRIAISMQQAFGERYLVWAMSLTGFVVGIPLYYNVGFMLLIPIIFSVAYQYKISLVHIGLPMMASLSVMHGFLPPHPSPIALVMAFNADVGLTFLYGIIIAIPAIIIAGPLYVQFVKNTPCKPALNQFCVDKPINELPSTLNSFVSSLLPVLVIGVCTVLMGFCVEESDTYQVLAFIGDPTTAMVLTIIYATFSLGVRMGKTLQQVMEVYGEAIKDIAMILLIIGSAGILKQVLVESGVSAEMTGLFLDSPLHPLIVAWLITAVLRLALGSATIAGLTAAGVVYPIAEQGQVDPNLLVLAIGSGSLFCSHVNDTAFWLFKEYFGLSMKDTFKTWTVMETLVSVVGLFGVMVLHIMLS
jgi:Gnt-I system high-affinity gluconate transporter